MRRVLEILKAPTGWGKSYRLRQIAREEQIVLAVPTHTVAVEQLRKAEEEGIEAKYIKGRRRFVCGRKMDLLGDREGVLEWVNEDGSFREDTPEEVRRRVGQDYLCCRRAGCEYDPFREQFLGEDVPLIVCTHAFLGVVPFVEDREYLPRGRVLAIDEADVFLGEIEKPKVLVSSVSLADLRNLLVEMERDLGVDTERELRVLERVFPSGSGMVFVNTGKALEKGRGYSPGVVRDVRKTVEVLEAIRKRIGRRPEAGGYREALKMGVEVLREVLSPSEEGEYSWIGENRVGVSRLLFSPSAWLRLNSLFSSLDPEKVILASATFPSSLRKFFPVHRWEVVETGARECETPFPDSKLYVVVGYREYDYENREDYADYGAQVIGRFSQGNAVVLMSSFRDTELLEERLRGKGFVVISQKEGEQAQRVVQEWREKGGILLGNISLWRGLNITEADRFFIYKLPFASPESPRAEALKSYQLSSHFAVAREEARNLFAQGTGRVVRENGKEKFLFVLDARLKHYRDFADVFREVPCRVYFLRLKEDDLNA